MNDEIGAQPASRRWSRRRGLGTLTAGMAAIPPKDALTESARQANAWIAAHPRA
jgi:hypothetical protein